MEPPLPYRDPGRATGGWVIWTAPVKGPGSRPVNATPWRCDGPW